MDFDPKYRKAKQSIPKNHHLERTSTTGGLNKARYISVGLLLITMNNCNEGESLAGFE
jgi:hypothetical protein